MFDFRMVDFRIFQNRSNQQNRPLWDHAEIDNFGTRLEGAGPAPRARAGPGPNIVPFFSICISLRPDFRREFDLEM